MVAALIETVQLEQNLNFPTKIHFSSGTQQLHVQYHVD